MPDGIDIRLQCVQVCFHILHFSLPMLGDDRIIEVRGQQQDGLVTDIHCHKR